MAKRWVQHPDGFTVGQLCRRQERGRTKLLTYVRLQLTVLQNICFRLDPSGTKFPNIVNHDPTQGIYDDTEAFPDEGWGSIYGLLRELHYLKHVKKLSWREKDEIRRWIWTCDQALKEDFRTLWLGFAPEDQYDRVI